jgi:hypothetical protein
MDEPSTEVPREIGYGMRQPLQITILLELLVTSIQEAVISDMFLALPRQVRER